MVTNPKNPPFFLDLPWKDGKYQPEVAAKWSANAPLAMVDQYIANLRKMTAIAFDAGDADTSIATIRVLDKNLNDYGVKHDFEIYKGDHLNRIAERIELKMVPFFTKALAAK